MSSATAAVYPAGPEDGKSGFPAGVSRGPASSLPPTDEADALIRTLGPFGPLGKCWIAFLLAVIAVGAVAYVRQLMRGLSVTAMNDFYSWGIYIVNFVFFIGISMAGTLISAILRITGARWRSPITRLAEAVTLFALIVAAPMVIIDMGRPDRFWHVMAYGRVQSPILWDVLSLNTYLAGSILYLYLPMIPDMALLRDRGAQFSPMRRRIYTLLAMGWQNTPEQHRRLERGIAVMAVIIIPVAVSIHTVTSWIFGMTLRPGWHSTIIGPDFVAGALYSGIAAVITAIALFRRFLHLERFISDLPFRKLGLLLLVSCVVYAYFIVNEYIGPGYAKEGVERRLLSALMQGRYAVHFWIMVSVGLIVPFLMLAVPWKRPVPWIFGASVLVNLGMWLKRYMIVVPTLNTTYLPPWKGELGIYVPTWVEWSIVAASFAMFWLLYTLFAKFVPIISVWELGESHADQSGNHAKEVRV